jgi:hypothetical protein
LCHRLERDKMDGVTCRVGIVYYSVTGECRGGRCNGVKGRG